MGVCRGEVFEKHGCSVDAMTVDDAEPYTLLAKFGNFRHGCSLLSVACQHAIEHKMSDLVTQGIDETLDVGGKTSWCIFQPLPCDVTGAGIAKGFQPVLERLHIRRCSRLAGAIEDAAAERRDHNHHAQTENVKSMIRFFALKNFQGNGIWGL